MNIISEDNSNLTENYIFFCSLCPFVLLYPCFCILTLEREMERESDSALAGIRIVAVSQSPCVIDTENTEDVIQTDTNLHIRLIGHLLRVCNLREAKQFRIQPRLVAVAQMAPYTLECDSLAQFQLLKQRNIVE